MSRPLKGMWDVKDMDGGIYITKEEQVLEPVDPRPFKADNEEVVMSCTYRLHMMGIDTTNLTAEQIVSIMNDMWEQHEADERNRVDRIIGIQSSYIEGTPNNRIASIGKSTMSLSRILEEMRREGIMIGDINSVVLDSEQAMRSSIISMDYSSIEDRIYAGLAKHLDNELIQTINAPKSKKELEKERKKQREDFHKFVNRRRRGKRK